jgi:uncharacterized tellurite resistance protein B-like protein
LIISLYSGNLPFLEETMLDLIKRYFIQNNDNRPASIGHEEPRRIMVATCALLLEMAAIDGEFSADEQDVILSILKNDYKMSENEAASLIKTAQAQREGSIDLWRFTNLINQSYSEEERIHIIELVWKVIYADGRLDGHEDHLVHGLANLLRLSHSQLIEAKLRVKGP